MTENTQICEYVKESLSFLKENKVDEAINSLNTAKSNLSDNESKLIKEVISTLESNDEKRVAEARHIMQAVIHQFECKGLRPY
jgi:hypothetical protein